MKTIAFFATLFVASQAWAAKISCEATGARQHGTSLAVFSLIQFEDQILATGVRALDHLEGSVCVDYDWDNDMSNLDASVCEDVHYDGAFNFDRINENVNYRPRKYKGYSQFPDFDAAESSRGMWGQLVVEKEYSSDKAFKAHYIFQAGDHIGGTIDYKCEVLR